MVISVASTPEGSGKLYGEIGVDGATVEICNLRAFLKELQIYYEIL